MTTNRVYMPARTPEEGLEEIIRFSGTQFEPEVVEAFVAWWQQKYKEKDPIINSDHSLELNEEDLLIDTSKLH